MDQKFVSVELLKNKLYEMSANTGKFAIVDGSVHHSLSSMDGVVSSKIQNALILSMNQFLRELINAISESAVDGPCILCRKPKAHEKKPTDQT